MEQIKSFVTGKATMANNMALFVSIGAAAYYQYSEQKKESMLEEGESLPKSNKKYILWGIVAAFMIPIVINAVTGDVKVVEIEAEPSSSFETSVSEAADALRSRKVAAAATEVKKVKTETEDFRTRVSEAARKLREQIAESSENRVSDAAESLKTQIEESSSETVEELKNTELAEKAGEEIRKFLSENS